MRHACTVAALLVAPLAGMHAADAPKLPPAEVPVFMRPDPQWTALLYHPNPKERHPLTLCISCDGMNTWPYQRVSNAAFKQLVKSRARGMQRPSAAVPK